MPTSTSFRFFQGLAEEITYYIGSQLDTPSKAALAGTNHRHHRIFAEDLAKAKHAIPLLELVTQGRQAEAEAIIRENPELLLERATATDPAGRTFHWNAFEYAFYVKHTHMCRMFLKYLDGNEDLRAKVLACAEAVEEHGLTFTQNAKAIHGAKHFDMSPLINALATYDSLVVADNNASETYAAKFLSSIWRKNRWSKALRNIGMAQRDLPMHILNEYCSPGRNFMPAPSFKQETLPTELTLITNFTFEEVEIFPLQESLGLGFDYVIAKGRFDDAYAVSTKDTKLCHIDCVCSNSTPTEDLEAIQRLDAVRTAETLEIIDALKPKAESHLRLSC